MTEEEIRDSFDEYIKEQNSNYKVEDVAIDSETGRVDVRIQDSRFGSGKDNYMYVELSYYPDNPESMQRAFTYHPGTKGDTVAGGLGDAIMNVATGDIDVVRSTLYNNEEVTGGIRTAISTGQIDPCVAVVCNYPSTNGESVELASTVLDAVTDIYGNSYSHMVIDSCSAGYKDARRMVAAYVDKADNIIMAFCDAADENGGATFLTDSQLRMTNPKVIDAFKSDKVKIVLLEAVGNDSYRPAGVARSQYGISVTVATNGDYKKYVHMEPVYTSIRNGQINAMLNGKMFAEDNNYIVSWFDLDSRGNVVRMEVDSDTINVLNSDEYTDEQKYLYYKLKTNKQIVPTGSISVEYQTVADKVNSILTYISNNASIDTYNPNITANSNINSLLAGVTPIANSTSILNYRVKEGLYEVTSSVMEIARTEQELTELTQMIELGMNDTIFDEYIQSKGSNTYVTLLGAQESFASGKFGSITFDELCSLYSNGSLSGELGRSLESEMTQSKELSEMLEEFYNDDCLTGEAFAGLKSTIYDYKISMDNRNMAASILYDVYTECLGKLVNYMAEHGNKDFDDTNLEKYKEQLKANLLQIDVLKEKANTVVYELVTETKLGGILSYNYKIATYPFKADCEAGIALLEEENVLLTEEIDFIEGYIVLLKACEEAINEANIEVKKIYSSNVDALPTFNGI